MICEAVIGTARRDDGSTSLKTLGSSPPLKLMPTPEGVFVVGTAAAPLGGDRISLDIYVAPGTVLTVRTVAASLAWPGTSPVPSQFTINARVGEGASLHWLPEPMVPVAGSKHLMVANIALAGDSELIWREEIVLGRHNEAPGELASRISVTAASRTVLRQELEITDGRHESPVVLGGCGATGSVSIFGRHGDEAAPFPGFPLADASGEAAILELECGGRQVVASAAASVQLRKLLDRGTQAVLDNTARPAGTNPRSEHAHVQ